ncbi:hypothetical protein TorRG33x02_014900 [Trema orientale]|uniref:Transmembrane protein n=1 Tax=Trema orientale TaxID=63057 RepID=A0A2P5FXI8_TREOI|nr:hypothetical protein TorRG33x02_014900 [Trema orientale]
MADSLLWVLSLSVMVAVEWMFALWSYFNIFLFIRDLLYDENFRLMLFNFTTSTLAVIGVPSGFLAGPSTALKIFHDLKRSFLRLPEIQWAFSINRYIVALVLGFFLEEIIANAPKAVPELSYYGSAAFNLFLFSRYVIYLPFSEYLLMLRGEVRYYSSHGTSQHSKRGRATNGNSSNDASEHSATNVHCNSFDDNTSQHLEHGRATSVLNNDSSSKDASEHSATSVLNSSSSNDALEHSGTNVLNSDSSSNTPQHLELGRATSVLNNDSSSNDASEHSATSVLNSHSSSDTSQHSKLGRATSVLDSDSSNDASEHSATRVLDSSNDTLQDWELLNVDSSDDTELQSTSTLSPEALSLPPLVTPPPSNKIPLLLLTAWPQLRYRRHGTQTGYNVDRITMIEDVDHMKLL